MQKQKKRVEVSRATFSLYPEHPAFIRANSIPAMRASIPQKRYASAQAVPVLDLRTKERKEEQAKAKRMEANKAQGRALVGFGIFATLATIAAQFLFAGSDRGDTN